MSTWPALCMHRPHKPPRPARHEVTATGGGERFTEVCCDGCLPAVRASAAKVGVPKVTAVNQPDGAELRTPPGDPQGGLFDGPGA